MFIRLAAAHDVAAQIAYRGASLADAAHDVVMNKLPRLAGRGGMIAVDAHGNVAMPFNTEGMYRGYARVGGARGRHLPRRRGVIADRTRRPSR
jgi:beta-aspartyl-peptidase (threonine type)